MTCLFTQPQAAASTPGEQNMGLNPTSFLPSHRSQVTFLILHKNLPFFVCNNRTAAGLVFSWQQHVLGDLSTERENRGGCNGWRTWSSSAEAGAGPAISEQPCKGSFELDLNAESRQPLI